MRVRRFIVIALGSSGAADSRSRPDGLTATMHRTSVDGRRMADVSAGTGLVMVVVRVTVIVGVPLSWERRDC